MDYLENDDWDKVKQVSRSRDYFKSVKDKTFDTKFGLIKSRLEMLPKHLWFEMTEYEDFIHLLYLATCLKHQFFSDFVLEVVREEYLLFKTKLTEDHFRSFLYSKMDDHSEIEDLKEYTQNKIRQNFMRILSEVDMLQSTRSWIISKPLLSDFLVSVVAQENNNYLKYYLWSDYEIDNLT